VTLAANGDKLYIGEGYAQNKAATLGDSGIVGGDNNAKEVFFFKGTDGVVKAVIETSVASSLGVANTAALDTPAADGVSVITLTGVTDLTKVGTVIDAGVQAGANDIGGIAFTLREDRPARDKALSEATREATSKAKVIAQALGGRVVRIAEVQEEGFQRPQPIYQTQEFSMARAQVASTPIEVGSLEIRSRVQLIAEIEAA